MNDLLTQGLANGNPIALLTQGLLIANNFVVECFSVVLSYQVSALAIALSPASFVLVAPVSKLSLVSPVNQINLSELNRTINLLQKTSEVTLNAVDRCPAT